MPPSAELCRDALDASSDGIVFVDSAGIIQSCNYGFLQLTGGVQSSASLNRLFPAGCRPLDFFSGARGTVSQECVLETPEGMVSAKVVYASNPEGVLASIDLEGSPTVSWSAAMLEASDSLLLVLDPRGHFVRFNRAAMTLTGYSGAEITGRPFWEVVLFVEDVEGMRREFQKLVTGELTESRLECRWKMKDGSARSFLWSNSVTRASDGTVQYVVATALDITAARSHQNRLASLSADFLEEQSVGRKNISAYLHDTVSQDLVVLALTLNKLQRAPDKSDPFEVTPTLNLIDRCCRDLRVISYALAPPEFEDGEPVAMFDWYISHLRQDGGMDVEFEAGATITDMPFAVRKLLLAALQEWAARAIRVRLIGSTRIRLGTLASGVRLEVSSDQPDNEAVMAVAASRVIRERVRALGGTLEIQPRQSGVTVCISIAAA